MKSLKLLFVVCILFVFHPFAVTGQAPKCKTTPVESGIDDAKRNNVKVDLQTIMLPFFNHLQLPVEIDREELLKRYNEMIEEIDEKYHSPATAVKDTKGLSIALAESVKKKGNE